MFKYMTDRLLNLRVKLGFTKSRVVNMAYPSETPSWELFPYRFSKLEFYGEISTSSNDEGELK